MGNLDVVSLNGEVLRRRTRLEQSFVEVQCRSVWLIVMGVGEWHTGFWVLCDSAWPAGQLPLGPLYDERRAQPCLSGSWLSGSCLSGPCLSGTCLSVRPLPGSCPSGPCLSGPCSFGPCLSGPCLSVHCLPCKAMKCNPLIGLKNKMIKV